MDAILRAGPFTGPSEGPSASFFNEQDPLIVGDFGSVYVYPVNCANTTSSSAWPWKYNDVFSKISTTHTGCESTPGGEIPIESSVISKSGSVKTATGDFFASNSATSNRGVSVITSLSFAYQATKSFDIRITYNGLAEASDDQTILSSSNILFFDTQGRTIDGFPRLNDSVTITLPASYIPRVYSSTLQVDVGVEFPDDICTPNPGSVEATSSLSFEFVE